MSVVSHYTVSVGQNNKQQVDAVVGISPSCAASLFSNTFTDPFYTVLESDANDLVHMSWLRYVTLWAGSTENSDVMVKDVGFPSLHACRD